MPVPPQWDLTGKVALLAGHQRQWFPILAQALAEAGACVAIASHGHHRDQMDEARKVVEAQGREALVLPTEVTSEAEVAGAVASVVQRWGRLDILANNAVVEFGKPFTQVTVQEWDTIMARSVRSTFLLCREAGKQMLKQGGGRIVNIISGLAERGLWNSAAFCATQGAVLQLTRALALEWGRHNIRVNAIGTGWYSLEEVPPEEAQKELLVRYIPVRRKGHPRDIAALLVYLASPACDYTTGQAVYVDGGLMAHA